MLKRPISRMQGFSLIELMIALTIGLVIMAAVMSVLYTASTNRQTHGRAVDLQANGRYALQVLRQDLQNAGFRGLAWTNVKENVFTAGVGAVGNDCGAGVVTNILQPIWGDNDKNPFAACISGYARGDVLLVRRVSGAPVNVAAASEANALHLRTEFNRAELFVGKTPTQPWAGPTPFTDYRVDTVVYYIGACTTAPATTGLCRLRLTAEGGALRMRPELVASGIENMQVRYGRADFGTQQIQYRDAGGINGASNAEESEWNSVNSVRVWLLSKAPSADAGVSKSTKYDLGDVSLNFSDGFRREVFSTVVNLRNIWTN
jgi:type IV pilus assembly protein PilW